MNKGIFWGSSLIILILSFLFDSQIVKFFVGLRWAIADYLFMIFGLISSLIILIILIILMLWNENKKRWIFPLTVSVILSIIISTGLKIIIARQRPFEVLNIFTSDIPFLFLSDSFKIWNFSFPSFHSMLIFSLIPLLDKEFKKLKYFWIIFGLLVVISRVYFGVHYLSDVLAGAMIGYLIGKLSLQIEEKYKIGKKIFN